MTEYIYIASIDPGKKNFAFSVEKVDISKCKNLKNIEDLYSVSETILMENIDLTKKIDTTKYLDTKIFVELTRVLDNYKKYWDMCSIILIEAQMSFRNRMNTMALKIAQHCFSYFTFLYATFKQIYEYPSYHKTQVLNAPKKMDKPARKKWAVETATRILETRKSSGILEILNSRRKKDDMCDCFLMNLTFIYQVYALNKVF